MPFLFSLYQEPAWFLGSLFALGLWSLIWKGMGLWYAAKHRQKSWFIVMLFVGLLGLLPIIYLRWYRPKEKAEEKVQHVSVRKKSVKKRTK